MWRFITVITITLKFFISTQFSHNAVKGVECFLIAYFKLISLIKFLFFSVSSICWQRMSCCQRLFASAFNCVTYLLSSLIMSVGIMSPSVFIIESMDKETSFVAQGLWFRFIHTRFHCLIFYWMLLLYLILQIKIDVYLTLSTSAYFNYSFNHASILFQLIL